MQRSKIKEILGRESAGGDVLVQGWVKTRRSSKAVSFVQVSDGSTLADIQVVADESLPNFQAVDALTTGCSVSVIGTLVESPGKGQKYEIHAKSIEVVGESDPDTYPLQKKRHTVEFLRDIAAKVRIHSIGAAGEVFEHFAPCRIFKIKTDTPLVSIKSLEEKTVFPHLEGRNIPAHVSSRPGVLNLDDVSSKIC